MSQEKMKRLTLGQAVERARQSNDDKMKLFDLESEFLGGALPCKKMPLDRVLGFMDDTMGDESVKGNIDFFCMLILKHSPLLQEEEFQKDFAVPTDAVKHLYHDNAGEILKHGKMILKQYGIGDLADVVKNS